MHHSIRSEYPRREVLAFHDSLNCTAIEKLFDLVYFTAC